MQACNKNNNTDIAAAAAVAAEHALFDGKLKE
jgi:hypothetical protein